ncbi:Peptide chain release factor 1 [Candidatus Hodgkinia cicadicola]|nr:Peptide chain release factor 1 [Candidatus Hodgkinia cicadicola]
MVKQKAHNLQNRVQSPVPLTQTTKLIIEIRPAVGGIEASLFAEQLLRMYSKFATKMGWTFEIMCANSFEGGGVKEVSMLVEGKDVKRWLVHEAGVHRVQRIPQTETRGRIHTSTVTVVTLATCDSVDQVQLVPSELKVETMRAGGAGGQHVNTTDSAVRITHLPSGVTACSSKKSQHQNKANAMTLLKHRLAALAKANMLSEQRSLRKAQVGTGNRTEKMRTYNFTQDRVTDHKSKISIKGANKILNGELKPFLLKLDAPPRPK